MSRDKSIIVLYLLTVFSLFSTLEVSAETYQSMSGQSKAALSLQKGKNEAAPGIIITEHEKDEITSQTGDVTIDYVPNFNFILNRIENGIGYYEMQLKDKAASFLQVSDRSGTGGGWTLDLTVKPFIGEKGSRLTSGTLIFHQIVLDKKATNVSKSPVFEKKIIYSIGEKSQSQPLIIANKGEGLFNWALKFEKEKKGLVTMEVPLEGNKTDRYTSTFLWQLLATPVD
ncbi:WxL domain-containing protein [Enterococcus rivorum]|uniref:WxL domain-containing protein n=1 Tax=Enterococcus rivorum TaxID=762845 RepID=A0A1E5KWY8_9ENTE|nr:WxL domain-containing protein [Enterococcus rivorum]MBP2097275.1 hypothetical protein [Enterococcus rivorum]OEH82373.1 hypothetical protein BCR26_02780 [Enterococcus rivorum]